MPQGSARRVRDNEEALNDKVNAEMVYSEIYLKVEKYSNWKTLFDIDDCHSDL